MCGLSRMRQYTKWWSLVLTGYFFLSSPTYAHDEIQFFYYPNYPNDHFKDHQRYNPYWDQDNHHRHRHIQHEPINPCYRNDASWKVRKACERQAYEDQHRGRHEQHQRKESGARFYHRDKHR